MARRTKARLFGGSMTADNSSYGAYLPHSAGLRPGTGSFTVSTWVKVGMESVADVNTHSICAYIPGGVTTGGWLLSQYGTQLLIYCQSASPVALTTFWANRSNRWVHLVVVFNATGNTITTYADGELVSGPTAAPVGAWNINGSSVFEVASNTFVGPRKSNIARTRYWVGLAMTAAQVASLYYDDLDPDSTLKVVDINWAEQTGTSVANNGTLGGSFVLNSILAWSSDVPACQVRRATQNLLPTSDAPTTANWPNNVGILSVTPDGTVTHPTRVGGVVNKVIESTANSGHVVRTYPLGSATASDAYGLIGRPGRFSVKLKKGAGRDWIYVSLNNTVNGVYFNLLTGVIDPSSTATGKVTDLGGGWFEVSVEAVGDVNHSLCTMWVCATPGTISFTGDGASYYYLCDPTYQPADQPSDYTPGLCYAGPQSTRPAPPQNLTSFSGTLSNGLWIKGNGLTVTDRGDGSWDLVDANGASTSSILKYAFGITDLLLDRPEKSYTLKFKVAKTTGGVQPTFVCSGPGSMGWYFNTDTGVVLLTQACTYEVTLVTVGGIDYWSVALTWKPWGLASPYFYFYPAYGVYGSTANDVASVGTARVRDVSVTNSNEPVYVETGATEMYGRAARSKVFRQNLLRASSDMTQVSSFARVGLTGVTALGAVGPGGVQAFRLTDTNSGTGHYLVQTITATTAGRVYTVGVVARSGTKTSIVLAPEGAGYQVSYNLTTGVVTPAVGTPVGSGMTDLGGGWYLCWFSFVGLGNATVRLYMHNTSYTADGTGTVDMCMPTLTETQSPAEYTETGISVSINEGAPRGQAPRQNYATNTASMHTAWSVSNSTLSAPSAGVCRVTENLATSEHIAFMSGLIPNNGNRLATISITAKAGTRSWMWLRGYSLFADYGYFDLVNGVVGATGPKVASSSIIPLGDGWYRCSITFIDRENAISTPYFCAGPASANNVYTYLGDGTGYIDVKDPCWTMTNGPVEHVPNPRAAPINEGAPRGLAS